MEQKKSEMSPLAEKSCIPCRGSSLKLTTQEVNHYLTELKAGWQVIDAHHIEKTYPFKDFKSGLAFVNKVGLLAEQEGHHPDIYLAWGKVEIRLWTHKINGLSESDFILAAKCDALDSKDN